MSLVARLDDGVFLGVGRQQQADGDDEQAAKLHVHLRRVMGRRQSRAAIRGSLTLWVPRTRR